MNNTVAILTDFGNKDGYTGIMKGVMLNINPSLQFIDISNEIEPFNILSASYVLYSAWNYFAKDTIFLAVIDPQVGSDRGELIAKIDDKYLIAPDNGIITILFLMKKNTQAFKLNRDKIISFNRNNISSTFHGRDIFSPACGILSKKGLKNVCGMKIDPVVINAVIPIIDNKKNKITGRIVHIDRFGNCITSIHKSSVVNFKYTGIIKIERTGLIIKGIKSFYLETGINKEIAYWGSSEFLEIAVRNNNAAKKLKIKQYDIITLQ